MSVPASLLVVSAAWLCVACSLVESLDGYGGAADIAASSGVGASAGSVGSAGGGAGGLGPCPDGHLPLSDSFDARMIDDALWTEMELPGVVVEHFEGQLRITLPGQGGGWAYGGVASKVSYDIKECSSFVDVGTLVGMGDVETTFGLQTHIEPQACIDAGLGTLEQCQDADAYMGFAVNQATLYARVGLVLQTTYVRASQSLLQTWWRLREENDRIHWEVSVNGDDWEYLHDEAIPWPPNTPVQLVLGLTTWTGLGGEASFESFNVAP